MNLANYKTSKDYGKLWELAQENEIVCMTDGFLYYAHAYAHASGDYTEVCLKGHCLLWCKTKVEFIQQCQSCNLEWLVPESDEIVEDCSTCSGYKEGRHHNTCVGCIDCSNWRPKEESEGE